MDFPQELPRAWLLEQQSLCKSKCNILCLLLQGKSQSGFEETTFNIDIQVILHNYLVLGGCRNNSTAVADSSVLTEVIKGGGEIERPIEHIVMLQHSKREV